ncbi:MAG TPA: SpoIIE family protein phosphatase [Terriglobales bacterium]|nr:SpoIIE family protein phosphatase [Terriglobales bacterium]
MEKTPRRGLQPASGLWDFLFPHSSEKSAANDPIRCEVPRLRGAEIAAVYYDQRRAGDFYEFVRVGRSRLLFALLDMAGRRADTRDILRAAQKTFREIAARRFGREDFNETTAMMDLCHALNRTILQGGIRACSGFLGCYNEDLGTICYANAGHTPALVHDVTGITRLEATGLPLGLFSHVPQSASTCALLPNAALVVVSRGIVEAECAGTEFGLEGTVRSIQGTIGFGAHELCTRVLQAAEEFVGVPLTHNDVTALGLVRTGSVA